MLICRSSEEIERLKEEMNNCINYYRNLIEAYESELNKTRTTFCQSRFTTGSICLMKKHIHQLHKLLKELVIAFSQWIESDHLLEYIHVSEPFPLLCTFTQLSEVHTYTQSTRRPTLSTQSAHTSNQSGCTSTQSDLLTTQSDRISTQSDRMSTQSDRMSTQSDHTSAQSDYTSTQSDLILTQSTHTSTALSASKPHTSMSVQSRGSLLTQTELFLSVREAEEAMFTPYSDNTESEDDEDSILNPTQTWRGEMFLREEFMNSQVMTMTCNVHTVLVKVPFFVNCSAIKLFQHCQVVNNYY